MQVPIEAVPDLVAKVAINLGVLRKAETPEQYHAALRPLMAAVERLREAMLVHGASFTRARIGRPPEWQWEVSLGRLPSGVSAADAVLRAGLTVYGFAEQGNQDAVMDTLRDIDLQKLGRAVDLARSELHEATAPPPAAEATASDSRPRKPSTERGEARTKLIAALTRHHRYSDGGCLNQEPIGNNELAKLADVSKSSASRFLNKEFRGRARYCQLCRDSHRLAAAMKALNGEYHPSDFYSARTPDEVEEADR